MLKRTGWWDPASGEAIVPAESDEQEAKDRNGLMAVAAVSAAARGSASASSAATRATGKANPVGGVVSRPPSLAPMTADGRTTAEVEDEDDDMMQEEAPQAAAAAAPESELEPSA